MGRHPTNPYARLLLWVAVWGAASYLLLAVASSGVFVLPFAFVVMPRRSRARPMPSALRHGAFIAAGLTLAMIGESNMDQSEHWVWPALLGGGIAVAIGSFVSYRARLRAFEGLHDQDSLGPPSLASSR